MNQFNHNLVDLYLVPLLKRVMVDISQGKHESLLKEDHWVSFESAEGQKNPQPVKARPAEVEKFQMEYFLHGQNDQSVKPFIDPDNQLYFIKFLQEAIRSQGADETTRRNFLIPTYKKDDKTPHFPPAAGRMLYLMAYKIAGEFQKIEMAKIIEQKSEAEKENLKKLQAQRRLIVTKNPTTGKFDQVQDVSKIPPGQKIVPLISPPSDYGAGFMYGSGDFSTAEGATNTGASGFGTASVGPGNAGLMPADITFPDDAVTMQTFQEKDENGNLQNIHLTISDDQKNPENKFYTFESENDQDKKFTISADKFKELSQDPETGKLRTIAEIYDLIEQQRMQAQETAAKILQAAQEFLGGKQPELGQKEPQVEQQQQGQVGQEQPPQKAAGQIAPMAAQGQTPPEAEKPETMAKEEPAPKPISPLSSISPVSQQQPVNGLRRPASMPTQGAQTAPTRGVSPQNTTPFNLKEAKEQMAANKKPPYDPNAPKREAPVEAKTETKGAQAQPQPPASTGYKPEIPKSQKGFMEKYGRRLAAGTVGAGILGAIFGPATYTAMVAYKII